ncbi:MAG: hypothetical protein K6G88_06120 [Lachnospiraceae bacterium]|nr:hypothetical protein [Lachnospiraceae bacterium]
MELTREKVADILDVIRKCIGENTEDIKVDYENTGSDIICGITNEYLSDMLSLIVDNNITVTGQVEDLYRCPCCGYKTLTELYNKDEGTGYCVCKYCNWEDDGATDEKEYRPINRGSMIEYRDNINYKRITKWII